MKYFFSYVIAWATVEALGNDLRKCGPANGRDGPRSALHVAEKVSRKSTSIGPELPSREDTRRAQPYPWPGVRSRPTKSIDEKSGVGEPDS